jgi:hypothetical protein
MDTIVARSAAHLAGGTGAELPRLAVWHFRAAILFLLAGLAFGLHMAASHDHTLTPVHAHLNLMGWASLALFGGYYALVPRKAAGRIAFAQFALSTIGILITIPSLALYLSGMPAAEPGAAIGSIIFFLGAILFAIVVFRR